MCGGGPRYSNNAAEEFPSLDFRRWSDVSSEKKLQTSSGAVRQPRGEGEEETEFCGGKERISCNKRGEKSHYIIRGRDPAGGEAWSNNNTGPPVAAAGVPSSSLKRRAVLLLQLLG